MENHSVEEQGRISPVPSSKQIGESLSGFTTCGTCGRSCKRTYCSVVCYRSAQRSQPIADRFWAKVRKGAPNACWPWEASRTGGRGGKRYGQFTVTVDGKQRHHGAHQFAYILTNGPIPEGLDVMHSCNNGICCNPAHLSVGTHRKNVQDAAADGLYHVPRPKRRKVSDADIADMIEMRRAGLKLVQIAAHFDVTDAFVSLAVRGLRRSHTSQQLRKVG